MNSNPAASKPQNMRQRAAGAQTPTPLKTMVGDQSDSTSVLGKAGYTGPETPMSIGKGMTTNVERQATGWRAPALAGWSKQTMGTTLNFENDSDISQTPRAAGA